MTFENWKTQQLERTFGIRRLEQLPVLEAWLQTDIKQRIAEEKLET